MKEVPFDFPKKRIIGHSQQASLTLWLLKTDKNFSEKMEKLIVNL